MKCVHCHNELSYFQVLKKTIVSKVGLTCPHCSNINYFTAKSRKRNTYITMILPVIIIGLVLLDVPLQFSIGIAGLVALISIFIIPYISELSKDEEPLW